MTHTQYAKIKKSLLGNKKDRDWEQRIVKTKLLCYGRTSTKVKSIIKDIDLDFLDQLEIRDHFDSLVWVYKLNTIKDWKVYKKYLNKYICTIDNWASCDSLKFDKHEDIKLYKQSLIYLASKAPFTRRVGLNIYFKLIKSRKNLKWVYCVFDSLKNEKDYYVNMAAAWLLCECFVKYRNQTLKYLNNHKTNNFIINKAISKCRDSFRVSKQDKKMLLNFKK